MAVVTISGTTATVARGVMRTVWSFATAITPSAGSIGTPLSAPHFPDKTITWRGTWVTGVTILVEGSNTATYTTGLTAWSTLSAPLGTGLNFSTGKIKQVAENPRWIRPRLSARTGVLGSAIIEIISGSSR